MSLADSLYNLQLIQEFCQEYLNQCCHFTLEDMLYAASSIKVRGALRRSAAATRALGEARPRSCSVRAPSAPPARFPRRRGAARRGAAPRRSALRGAAGRRQRGAASGRDDPPRPRAGGRTSAGSCVRGGRGRTSTERGTDSAFSVRGPEGRGHPPAPLPPCVRVLRGLRGSGCYSKAVYPKGGGGRDSGPVPERGGRTVAVDAPDAERLGRPELWVPAQPSPC